MHGTTNYYLHGKQQQNTDARSKWTDFVENWVMLVSSSFNPVAVIHVPISRTKIC